MKKVNLKRGVSVSCFVYCDRKPDSISAFDKVDEYYNFDHFKAGERVVKVNVIDPKTNEVYFDSTGAIINKVVVKPLQKNRANIPLPTFEHESNTNKIVWERNVAGKGLAYCLPFDKEQFKICTSPEFEKLPSYIKSFIVFHELGHSKYRDEQKADLYAFKKCIEKGYSYRQIVHAIDRTLKPSPENKRRVEAAIKNALKYYSNESR